MTLQSFTCNPFQTNGYVAHSAGEAVLVDAPSHTEAEHQAVLDYLDQHGLTVRHLLLTHAHLDHIFGCAFFADRFDLSWQLHEADLPLIERAEEQATAFGVPLKTPPEPETCLQEGDVISFGEAKWRVLHTPGHAPGHVTFHDAEAGIVCSGDVLFKDSIGRVDLPGGSMEVLMRSIREKLLPLGEEVTVYPGHGPSTTLGAERASNPFLTGQYAAQ